VLQHGLLIDVTQFSVSANRAAARRRGRRAAARLAIATNSVAPLNPC